MPTPKLHPTYINEIEYYVSENKKVPAVWIHDQLKKLRENISPEDDLPEAPALRTVQRYVRKLKNPEEQARLADEKLFRFPESMENGWIPWEATRDCLDLLRWCLDNNHGRPIIRLAKWYWRVCLADPIGTIVTKRGFEESLLCNTRNQIEETSRTAVIQEQAKIRERLLKAEQLSYSERLLQLSPEDTNQSVELTEYELAYQPWRSEADKEAFEKAIHLHDIKPVIIPSRLFHLLAGLPQTGRLAERYKGGDI